MKNDEFLTLDLEEINIDNLIGKKIDLSEE